MTATATTDVDPRDDADASDDGEERELRDEAGEDESGREPDEDDQDEDAAAERRRVSVPPPMKRGYVRPTVGTGSDEAEVGANAVINEALRRLAKDDQAYVTYTRVKPQTIAGQPAGGWTRRVPVSTLRNADDLLEQIDNESGGTQYDIKFYATKDSKGRIGYYKGVRININSAPKLRTDSSMHMGGQAVPMPTPVSEKMTSETFGLMKDMLNDLRNGKGPSNQDQSQFLSLIRDITASQVAASESGYKQTIEVQQREIERMHKSIDDLKKSPSLPLVAPGPSAEVLSHVTDKAQDSVMQLQREFQAERTRWEAERAGIVERYNSQIERLTDKVHDLQEKMEERLRAKEEQHSKEKQAELNRLDDRLTADIKRLTQQLEDERRSADKLREMHELHTRTQLAQQEGVFKERIEGLNSQLKIAEERARDDERRYRDLERQRDDLRKEVLDIRTAPKPDSLEATKSTITAMTGMMGALGWTKDGGGGAASLPDEPTAVQWMRGMKETGIVDAARGIIGKVADAVASRGAAAQQPQVVYQPVPVPYVPQGAQQPIFQPSAAPAQVAAPSGPPPFAAAQPSQPASAPTQTGRPTRNVRRAAAEGQHPAQQPPEQQTAAPAEEPAPPEMSDMERQAWGAILAQFENGLENGVSPADMSQQIRDQFPPVALRQVLDAGLGRFMDAVDQVVKLRTENPETTLATPRGQTWLRDVFSATQRALAG